MNAGHWALNFGQLELSGSQELSYLLGQRFQDQPHKIEDLGHRLDKRDLDLAWENIQRCTETERFFNCFVGYTQPDGTRNEVFVRGEVDQFEGVKPIHAHGFFIDQGLLTSDQLLGSLLSNDTATHQHVRETSHDLNNLLAIILGKLELLSTFNLDPTANGHVEACINSTLDASKLTTALLERIPTPSDDRTKAMPPQATLQNDLRGSEEFTSEPTDLGRVLLVEDQDEVREIFSMMLRNLGYSVCIARDGDEGFATFERDGGFDLVVTDIMMPGTLLGNEMVSALRKRGHDFCAVFISAYAPNFASDSPDLEPNDVVLAKPVTIADLRSALEKRPIPVVEPDASKTSSPLFPR